MDFRIATEADVTQLVSLINNAYRGDSSRKGWTTEADILGGLRIDAAGVREILQDPSADLHLFQNESGELQACVYLAEKQDHLYLGMLSVNPDSQGSGIGKRILEYADEVAKQKGLKKIRMTVIHLRKELIGWYMRHGYELTGETEPWIDGVHIGERKTDFHFLVLQKNL
jgi:ribosomal protein S18 acetylase RimI-like enzyme